MLTSLLASNVQRYTDSNTNKKWNKVTLKRKYKSIETYLTSHNLPLDRAGKPVEKKMIFGFLNELGIIDVLFRL